MLQQLRRASKSWVASAVIGVLVLAFALWGVADIFRGGGDTVVADVGSAQISSADYDRQMRNQIRAFSAQTQTEITMDQAKAIGLDRNVLEMAISQAALDEEGKSLGLTASQKRSTTRSRATRTSSARAALSIRTSSSARFRTTDFRRRASWRSLPRTSPAVS